jgi:hypothetical protein
MMEEGESLLLDDRIAKADRALLVRLKAAGEQVFNALTASVYVLTGTSHEWVPIDGQFSIAGADLIRDLRDRDGDVRFEVDGNVNATWRQGLLRELGDELAARGVSFSPVEPQR